MQPMPDGSIYFVNLLAEDTELEIMQLGDTAEFTRQFFLEELPRKVKNPSALLLFQCGARSLIASSTNSVPALSQTFTYAPTAAGLNCSFEIYCGFQINTTLCTLVFGENP